MIAIQELLLEGLYKFPNPPQNFLGTHLDTKGLHYGIVCHPISKMPRMLIVSSASIRSGSSNDHMSGTLNVYMYVLETCYRTHLFGLLSLIHFKSSTMIYAFYFIGHLVLKYIWGMMCPFSCCPLHAEKECVIPVFLSHIFCLMYFTPCWGLCFTNRNRTIL